MSVRAERQSDEHQLFLMSGLNRVLILAQESVVGALIGLLVELTERNPVFAKTDEALSDALLRLRPLAVVLVDASIDAAQSDIFFAVTGRHGAGIAVFGSERDARSIAEIAATRSIPWFTLPPTATSSQPSFPWHRGSARTLMSVRRIAVAPRTRWSRLTGREFCETALDDGGWFMIVGQVPTDGARSRMRRL